MGTNTKIEWAHHTFNPWWGCTKVSAGCANCYAERDSKRYGHDIWGDKQPRRFFGGNHWEQPIKWNKRAREEGIRYRVFCASMADVFEDRDDLRPLQLKLFSLVEMTPFLDWLLLTKRPENMNLLTPRTWRSRWPNNAWALTTAENQEELDRRIPFLFEVPAIVRGISSEPLLGPLDLRSYLPLLDEQKIDWSEDPYRPVSKKKGKMLDWVIVGGESGPHSRPMIPDWARSIRDQCDLIGAHYFFKQWGEWHEFQDNGPLPKNCKYVGLDGSVRIGDFEKRTDVCMGKVGKNEAGRLLDGREWNEVPKPLSYIRAGNDASDKDRRFKKTEQVRS